jgi:glutaredoxin
MSRLRALFGGRQSIQRSPEEQAALDARTTALSLYQFPSCPYCLRVRRAIRRLHLNIELRNASNNPDWRHELVTRGGKLQVPCLRIEHSPEKVEWLYESADIIRYLKRNFDSG